MVQEAGRNGVARIQDKASVESSSFGSSRSRCSPKRDLAAGGGGARGFRTSLLAASKMIAYYRVSKGARLKVSISHEAHFGQQAAGCAVEWRQ